MSEWKEYKLGSIIDVRDGTHDSPKQKEKGKPLVTSKHIKGGKIDLSTAYLISIDDFDKVNKRSKVERWDVLFSMIGTIGEMVIVKEEPDFAIKNVGLFKAKDEYTSKWIYYYLKSPKAQSEILSSLKGSTQQYISLTDLRNFPITLPPKKEGVKIVEILSSLDDKIELNNKINQELETLAQTLFKQWFIDFEFPNENGEPYKSSGGEMVDSELGEIPKGWKVSEIGLVTKLGAGGDKPKKVSNTPTEELNIPIYSNGITNDGLYGYTNEAKIFEESVTISARGTIGFICLRTTPFVPIVRLISVIAVENYLSTKFLYMWLKNQIIVGNGTTQQQLTVPDFKGSKIIIPAKSLVNEFTNQMNLIIDNINFNKKENKELTNLRDTLLPKLISGELEINQITN